MKNTRRFGVLATVLTVCALALSLLGGAAQAASPKVWLGGGSAILVLTSRNAASACTLGTIGYDQRGDLVGITAGHCGMLGQPVLSEIWQGRGPVGEIVAKRGPLDYAIIRFDKSKVRPTERVGGVTIRGISTATPGFGSILCKQGRSSGKTCGITWFSDRKTHTSQICVVSGDSGSPVVLGDKLIGIVNQFFAVACLGPENGMNIGAILRDAKQRHGTNPYFMTSYRPV